MGEYMYKIKEAAKILGVETIEIHRKLINLKSELKGHTISKNGIITIDEFGLNLIERSFINLEEDNFVNKDPELEIACEEQNEVDYDDYHSNEEIDIDVEILETKAAIYDLKKQIMDLDKNINYKTDELNRKSNDLNAVTRKLKLVEKEYYNRIVRG